LIGEEQAGRERYGSAGHGAMAIGRDASVPVPRLLFRKLREASALVVGVRDERRIRNVDRSSARRAVRRARGYDMKAFLIGSINNACKHYWRKRKYEEPLLPHHELVSSDDEAAKLEHWTLRLSLGATLARLGRKCSETLRRYYLGEESAESIADALETSPAYIWQLLSSCRKRARQIYCAITRPKS